MVDNRPVTIVLSADQARLVNVALTHVCGHPTPAPGFHHFPKHVVDETRGALIAAMAAAGIDLHN